MTDSGQLLQTESNRNRIFYGYSHIVLYARIPFRHFPDHPDSLPVQRRIDSTDHFNIFQTSIRVDNERARDTSLYSILLSNSRIFYACCQIFQQRSLSTRKFRHLLHYRKDTTGRIDFFNLPLHDTRGCFFLSTGKPESYRYRIFDINRFAPATIPAWRLSHAKPPHSVPDLPHESLLPPR